MKVLVFISLVLSFFSIQANGEEYSLPEGLYVPKNLSIHRLKKSDKYDIPYLALKTSEVERGKNIGKLILKRVGAVCKREGYLSTLDFRLKTGKKRGFYSYFFNELEVKYKIDTYIRGKSISGGIGLFLATGGLITPISILRGKYLLEDKAHLKSSWGAGYGISHLLDRRLDDVMLEGIFKTQYAYFSHIDCLKEERWLEERAISQFETKHACFLLHGSVCEGLPFEEVKCLVDLASNDLPDIGQMCREIASIGDKNASECVVGSFRHESKGVDALEAFGIYKDHCSNIQERRQLKCVLKSIRKKKADIRITSSLEGYVQKCDR